MEPNFRRRTIPRLRPGDPVSADWLNRIVDALNDAQSLRTLAPRGGGDAVSLDEEAGERVTFPWEIRATLEFKDGLWTSLVTCAGGNVATAAGIPTRVPGDKVEYSDLESAISATGSGVTTSYMSCVISVPVVMLAQIYSFPESEDGPEHTWFDYLYLYGTGKVGQLQFADQVDNEHLPQGEGYVAGCQLPTDFGETTATIEIGRVCYALDSYVGLPPRVRIWRILQRVRSDFFVDSGVYNALD